jgi:hypothetical protein
VAIEKSLVLIYQTPLLAARREGLSGITSLHKYKPAENSAAVGTAVAMPDWQIVSSLGEAALPDIGLKCLPCRCSFKLFAGLLRQRLSRWHAFDPDRAAP